MHSLTFRVRAMLS